jgi:hypothetical protein
MSKTILLVGCGQIGFRHLQACLNTKVIKNIDILEKVDISKDISSLIKSSDKNINYLKNLNKLSKNYDLLIFSTTSNYTYSIFKKLSEKIIFKRVLFEKITFSKIEQYKKANKILLAKNIKAWVDCSSRYQNFFNFIKSKINNKFKMTMISETSNDYFISNFIHNHDIFNFIINANTSKIISLKVDSIFNSKRKGYHDIEGEALIRSKNGSFFYSKNRNTSSSFEQKFYFLQKRRFIYAVFKDYKIYVKLNNNKKIKTYLFKFEFQSILSKKIILDIFSNKSKLIDFKNYSKIQTDILNWTYFVLKNKKKINFT